MHSLKKSMRQLSTSWLWLLASFTLPIAIAVGVKAVVRLQQPSSPLPIASQRGCQTIIADPKPPMNVRSSPVVASDNVIGRLPNGLSLSVIDENEGWLKISSPLQGWVYKELTVTSCGAMNGMAIPQSGSLTGIAAQSPSDSDTHLMAIATQQYQAGNLDGALALAKTVPFDSPIYLMATDAAAQWQQDWNRAESDYYSAQKALRDGRWDRVLSQVDQYPPIRFWKEKLAMLVKQAIAQQKTSQNKKEAQLPPSQNPD